MQTTVRIDYKVILETRAITNTNKVKFLQFLDNYIILTSHVMRHFPLVLPSFTKPLISILRIIAISSLDDLKTQGMLPITVTLLFVLK